MKKIVFTGGGTLGHVMPNIYLMEELKEDYNMVYIGGNGIEKEKIQNLSVLSGENSGLPDNGGCEEKEKLKAEQRKQAKNRQITYNEIPTVKLVRGKILQNIKIPFVLIDAIIKSKKYLKKEKPDVIFSKGGYVSLPVCIAARMLKIPVVAHESDYSFGLANKIILKTCNTMCVNFRNLEGKNKKIVYTGPIFSKEFAALSLDSKQKEIKKNKLKLNLSTDKRTILIVGGSLGSQAINEIVFTCVRDLIKEFNVIHIVGKGNMTLKSYDNYNTLEMTDEMPYLYSIADLVVGRSGAGVTAECFYKRLPMILIPLANKATRGDQVLNAEYYRDLQVAEIITQSDLTPQKLIFLIQSMMKELYKYSETYRTLNIINGKDEIIKMIAEYANQI